MEEPIEFDTKKNLRQLTILLAALAIIIDLIGLFGLLYNGSRYDFWTTFIMFISLPAFMGLLILWLHRSSGNLRFRFDLSGFTVFKGSRIKLHFSREQIKDFKLSPYGGIILQVEGRPDYPLRGMEPKSLLYKKLITGLAGMIDARYSGGCRFCGSPQNLGIYSVYYGTRKAPGKEGWLSDEPFSLKICKSCLEKKVKENRISGLKSLLFFGAFFGTAITLAALNNPRGIIPLSVAGGLLSLFPLASILLKPEDLAIGITRRYVMTRKTSGGYNIFPGEKQVEQFRKSL